MKQYYKSDRIVRIGEYVSPEVTVNDVVIEGVLCGSMKDNENEPWGEEDLW